MDVSVSRTGALGFGNHFMLLGCHPSFRFPPLAFAFILENSVGVLGQVELLPRQVLNSPDVLRDDCQQFFFVFQGMLPNEVVRVCGEPLYQDHQFLSCFPAEPGMFFREDFEWSRFITEPVEMNGLAPAKTGHGVTLKL
ncbi:hypothetical protein BGV48_20325 [Burkholderia ubonensis]|nr:hypothetical protein BGV48_20325 [Burkholderia ubonensis]